MAGGQKPIKKVEQNGLALLKQLSKLLILFSVPLAKKVLKIAEGIEKTEQAIIAKAKDGSTLKAA